uniref:Probable lipid II flippase MurJ n=1 Tax=Candidatus Kentrum sp. MB TaxID=2138164 RepID=A0A451B7V5_9GAMM|nr:MAG: putative peptidoglycan lipid II flippase [Candidatus Kentron sp. MB]VFK27625.1 MAG: putative peptidoglycan lipid II flippase [Candidatus Kentron sp. MB]VFK74365.1 MAG: putative peptidoglycan lipid II flippase [Candidatus Kentron sp. MB]
MSHPAKPVSNPAPSLTPPPSRHKLLGRAITVSANTFLSRIAGLIRDIVIAAVFGAKEEADAFFVAFRIPNLLRRLFAEGAFSPAFVPVLSEYKSQRSHAQVRNLISHVIGKLGAIVFLTTLIGILTAPFLVILFAPGFFLQYADKYTLTVRMLMITFPYLLFISLTAAAAGILNTYGRFGVPAFTPVLLNLSLIAAAIWLAPQLAEPVLALAWGVFIAGLAQLLFQLPFLHRLRLLTWPRFRGKHQGVQRIIRLLIPALFGVSVVQINLLVDTLIASFLVTGSVSWLYYSDRLVEFPLGVFGIALATVILPNLSRRHVEGSGARFSQTLDWALRLVLLIAAPAAIGLALLAEPMLTTLFQYGKLGQHDIHMAAQSLMAYAFGLLGFVGIKVLAPGFYARQDTRAPVRIGVIAMLANMVFNLLLVFPLAHAGLALATALSAFLNAGLLYLGLRREGVYRPQSGWAGFAARVLAANLVMVGILWFIKGDTSAWIAADAITRTLRLTATISLGALGYFCALLLFGVRPRDLTAP